MRFITSIFMLLTATSGVISAYFIGHGIVVRHEETWPWLAAAALLAASVLYGFVYFALAKRDPQPAAHGHTGTHTHADGTVHTHAHDGPGHTHP